MPDYSIDSLENGIQAAKRNISTFEEAIANERRTISEYYDMIDVVKRKEREAAIRDNISKNIEIERVDE